MFKKVKEIKSKTGVVHFTRWLIFCIPKKNINLFLHRIARADEDKHEHDHPWDFYSIVLRGGYVEQADGLINVRRPGNYAFKKSTETHKILKMMVIPTWTLVLTCGERRKWGYKTEDGWVDFMTYRTNKRIGLYD